MSQPADFSWKNIRILVADDEPDMREIFAAWLRSLGCQVSEAADGLEALEVLAEGHFDAIVTDVRMPRVDGVELMRRLQRAGRYIPAVIFVSGFVDLSLPDAYDLGAPPGTRFRAWRQKSCTPGGAAAGNLCVQYGRSAGGSGAGWPVFQL